MHHLNGVKAMRKSILILCILIKFVFSSMVRYTICCKNTKFSWIKCKIIFFSAYKSKNGQQYPNGNQPEWECSDGVILIFFSSESFHDTFGRFWGKHVAPSGQISLPVCAQKCITNRALDGVCVYPKSVIRPFIVFFNYCLQSFVFYKASFVCF